MTKFTPGTMILLSDLNVEGEIVRQIENEFFVRWNDERGSRSIETIGSLRLAKIIKQREEQS